MPEQPYLLVVVGPNGSGKSSIIRNLIDEEPANNFIRQLRMVNADIAEQAIAVISSIEDPLIRATEAQRWCNRERKDLLGKQKSFGYETVGSHPIPGERHFDFMQQTRKRGYIVEMLFVSTESPAINLRRIKRRVSEGGHNVAKEKVIKRYHRTMEFLPEFLNACDAALVVDNSIDDEPYRTLLHWKNGSYTLSKPSTGVCWLNTYLLDKEPKE